MMQRHTFWRLGSIFLLLTLLAGGLAVPAPTNAQSTGSGGDIQQVIKTATPDRIGPTETSTISLQLNATTCTNAVTVPASVALVIDSSSSMGSVFSGGSPEKIGAARDAAKGFVDNLQPQDQVSVVEFAPGARSLLSPDLVTVGPVGGNTRTVVKEAIDTIDGLGGGTNIQAGIDTGAATLTGAESKTLILLSDGEPTSPAGQPRSPSQLALDAAIAAKNAGITVYAIGYDLAGNSSALSLLRDIASDPNTTFFEAPDAGQLDQIYNQISRQLVRSGPIGTNATIVETYDQTQFDVVSASDNGVIDAAAGTITWTFATLNSDQRVSYVVRPKFDNNRYFASTNTDYAYTRGSDCANAAQQTVFTGLPGAPVQVGSTAITLDSFTAVKRANGVDIQWVTSAEINTAGFHLLRSSNGNISGATRITSELIPATGRADLGDTYTYTDTTAEPGQSYTYWLEETELNGTTMQYGPFIVTPEPENSNRRVFLPLLRK